MKKLTVVNTVTGRIYELVTNNNDAYGKIDVLDFHGVVRNLEFGEEREEGFKLVERMVEYSWGDFSDLIVETDYSEDNRLHA
jgi:hypothetical protein